MTREDRFLLHCDCNNFFASVELRSRPDLKDVPVAVAGDPESRHGIILAKNMPAKKLGIVTAETVWSAKQKCPDLILLPPHQELYHQVSREINAIYLNYTDQVEPFSVDESFLDVTGSTRLFGSGEEIALQLRTRIREEIGITISVGISFNKTWAKMGSDYKKPDATTVMDRTTAPQILYPQPIEQMLFVGKSSAAVLRSHGIRTIGDLVTNGREIAERYLGKAGKALWENAAGFDKSPVRFWGDEEAPKSISHAETFAHDLVGRPACRKALLTLSERVGRRLRAEHMKGTTVSLQIKNPSLKVISRQTTLSYATASTDVIFRTACELLEEAIPEDQPVRLFSVAVTGLQSEDQPTSEQLSFLDAPKADDPKRLALEKTLDGLQARFGKDLVHRGI